VARLVFTAKIYWQTLPASRSDQKKNKRRQIEIAKNAPLFLFYHREGEHAYYFLGKNESPEQNPEPIRKELQDLET